MPNLIIPSLSPEEIRKFWGCANVTLNERECWEWNRGCIKGYGVIYIQGKNYRANRISFFIQFGIDPEEFEVCHKCHNSRCINPFHLKMADHQINMRDSRGRLTGRSGENHHSAKLLPAQVAEIRKKAAMGIPQKTLLQEYPVSAGTLSGIIRRRYWKHLP